MYFWNHKKLSEKMQEFRLEVFLDVKGIGSASGILFHKNSLFIISDNSTFLYEYHLASNSFEKYSLVTNPQENILKKDKPDFESMALNGNEIILLGSGSTENRNSAKSYHLKTKEIKTIDFTGYFEDFKRIASLSDAELNIEGLIITKNKSYFFQRGNAENCSNGIFIKDESKPKNIQFNKIILPKPNNIQASFTDAILVNETIYFLAAVENTSSTYDDGEVLGTYIGKINSTTFNIEYTQLISENNKFEGITFYKETINQLEFLLCEDKDTEELHSKIFKLTLNK